MDNENGVAGKLVDPLSLPARGQIAQLVEQRTENPCVASSILALAKIHFFLG